MARAERKEWIGSSTGKRGAASREIARRDLRGGDHRGSNNRGPVNRSSDTRILDDQGMATVEYALVTVAAAGFAGLLIVLLKSSEVRELLAGIIQQALGG